MIDTKRLLVLADWQDAIFDRNVFAGEHKMHTGMHQSTRYIDLADSRVGMRRAQQLAVKHSWEEKIVGVTGLPSNFGSCVHASPRLADNPQIVASSAGF